MTAVGRWRRSSLATVRAPREARASGRTSRTACASPRPANDCRIPSAEPERAACLIVQVPVGRRHPKDERQHGPAVSIHVAVPPWAHKWLRDERGERGRGQAQDDVGWAETGRPHRPQGAAVLIPADAQAGGHHPWHWRRQLQPSRRSVKKRASFPTLPRLTQH